VLPMVLDSETKPLNDDIAIQIPAKDQTATAAAPAGPATQPSPAPEIPAPAALDQKEEIIEPAKVAPEPAAPVTPPVAQVAPPKPVEKTAAKPEDKTPAPPRETPKKDTKSEPRKDVKEAPKPRASEPADDSARALAILEGRTGAADKKPAAAGKFVIQVAALASADKVSELRNKLSGSGIRSYTQKIATQSGERTRIRVGPFGSRDEAEKMSARIKKLGLNATIVPA